MIEKIICKKNDIILKKYDYCQFSIEFISENNTDLLIKNINEIINNNLFNLIATLNTDIIENIKINKNENNNDINILYIFKRFGQDFGISKKYIYQKILLINNDKNNINIKNYSIPYINKDNILFDEDPIEITGECLIQILDNNSVSFYYKFKIELEEEIPEFMENLLGILYKKLFYRLKTFIENIYK